MVDFDYIIRSFSQNTVLFQKHLDLITEDFRLWRPAPDKWCMHEILCHLLDEEREDFRARIQSIFKDPNQPFVPIDPEGWVTSRKYLDTVYGEVLSAFVAERGRSLTWLDAHRDANWNATHQHKHFGAMSAKLFLHNWLAHDYLHLRQITRYRFLYLQEKGGESLEYAGEW